MVFGYARVSISDQSLDLQLDALLKEGIHKKNIYKDKVSSAVEERKNLQKLRESVREGETIVVWKLDRLARSLIHFTKLMNQLEDKAGEIQEHYRTFYRHYQKIIAFQVFGQYVRRIGTARAGYYY